MRTPPTHRCKWLRYRFTERRKILIRITRFKKQNNNNNVLTIFLSSPYLFIGMQIFCGTIHHFVARFIVLAVTFKWHRFRRYIRAVFQSGMQARDLRTSQLHVRRRGVAVETVCSAGQAQCSWHHVLIW